MDSEAQAYFDWVLCKSGLFGVKIDPSTWKRDIPGRFASVLLMGRYLVDRHAGVRGHGPVGHSTLVGVLSRLRSWLQRKRGMGYDCRTFSTLCYPKLFATLRKLAEVGKWLTEGSSLRFH